VQESRIFRQPADFIKRYLASINAQPSSVGAEKPVRE
jgi:hypothetical protein